MLATACAVLVGCLPHRPQHRYARCSRSDLYPRAFDFHFTLPEGGCIEALLLCVLTIDTVLMMVVIGPARSLNHYATTIRLGVLGLSFIDLFVVLMVTEGSVRMAPYLRVTYLVLHNQQLWLQIRLINKILPGLFSVLGMMAALILISTWFGIVLFQPGSDEGDSILPNFTEGGCVTSGMSTYSHPHAAPHAPHGPPSRLVTNNHDVLLSYRP